MNEYPINLKTWEVQAILSGRKTQIRTPLKPKPYLYEDDWFWPHGNLVYGLPKPKDKYPEFLGIWDALHQWRPGTRRWVRETWCGKINTDGNISSICAYKASCTDDHKYSFTPNEGEFTGIAGHTGWRPSIHMPRWASRITLVIKRAWIERLQDIREENAEMEGIYPVTQFGLLGQRKKMFCVPGLIGTYADGQHGERVCHTAKDGFAELWDTIYKPPFDYESDPWVIASEIEVV